VPSPGSTLLQGRSDELLSRWLVQECRWNMEALL
jgi:hypothetical protein